MKIPNEILEVLFNWKQELNKFYLWEQQLDRKIYLKTSEILETIGFKWNKKEKCHIYEWEDYEFIDSIFREMFASWEITTIKEEIKKYQFFPTPEKIVDLLVDLAEIKEEDLILEPSAWTWNIVKWITKKQTSCHIYINELDINKIPLLYELKEENLYIQQITNLDFLEFDWYNNYSKIIMNPPFSQNNAIKHILKAYSLLTRWWMLVSICPSNILTKEYKSLTEELNNLNPEVIELEEWSFKESWTMINTIILKLIK